MSELLVERRGAVAELWLNRPAVLNALSASLQEQIISTLAELHHDPDVAVVLLAGRGRSFTAGADLTTIQAIAESPDQRLEAFARGERLVRSLLESRLTMVLAAHGHCVGGGVSLALAADIVLAADGTQFFIPELALGMPYLWQSTPLLLATVGASRARALIATGDRFDAAQAHHMGLVHRVVPAVDLIDEARRIAQGLAEKPKGALEAQKRLNIRTLNRLLADSESEFALLHGAAAADR